MEKASEQFIDSIYYHQLYFLESCWKCDSRVMARELKKIKSDNAKYSALKENIDIRVKDFVGIGVNMLGHTKEMSTR